MPLVARCVALGCHPERWPGLAWPAACGRRAVQGDGITGGWWPSRTPGCCWITNLHHKRARQDRNHTNRIYDLDHTRGILAASAPTDGRSPRAGPGHDHRRCRCRGGPSYPPGYPGDLPCPTKGAAIQNHDDEDQGMLQRGTLGVRQQRYGEAKLRRVGHNRNRCEGDIQLSGSKAPG